MSKGSKFNLAAWHQHGRSCADVARALMNHQLSTGTCASGASGAKEEGCARRNAAGSNASCLSATCANGASGAKEEGCARRNAAGSNAGCF